MTTDVTRFDALPENARKYIGYIENLTGVPVLSTINLMESSIERRQRQRRTWLLLIILVIGFIAALTLFHFFVMPLDILWIKLQRRAARL